ncbi:MAG: class I SAM-dependent methyltransferase, partial [Candidatus Paceibacterota bacterium]
MNNNSDLEKYNDELSEIYDEVTKQPKYGWNTPNKVFEYVRDYLVKHSKVLELGVGTGQTIKPVSKITTNLVGVDISQEMIKKAKKKVPEADFYNLDLSSNFVSEKDFDLVIASGVTEFVENIGFLFK